jgi:hypothetical protein
MSDQAPAYGETAPTILTVDQISEWVQNIDNDNDMRLDAPPEENYTETLEWQERVIGSVHAALRSGERTASELAFLIRHVAGEDRRDLLVAVKLADETKYEEVRELLEDEAPAEPGTSLPAINASKLLGEFHPSKLGSTLRIDNEVYFLKSGPQPMILESMVDGKEYVAQ